MKQYSDFDWIETLYEDDIPWVKIIPHDIHPGMYWIEWIADGSRSPDFYNKSRAKDNARKQVCSRVNRASRTAKKQVDTAH